jgi:archaellum component FlaC
MMGILGRGMLKGLIRDGELVHRAEWLETLSLHCGIGRWDAILYEGDAMHPMARWTWSSEFRRLCVYKTEAEFPNIVQSWSDRLHPDDAAATFAAFGSTCQTGVGYDVKYRLKVKDGSYRWFRATGGVVLDEKGRPRRACGSLVDIDELMKAEEERTSLIRRLATDFENVIGKIVDTVSTASNELENSASRLSSTAERSQQLTTTAATASESASTNVQSVATATKEISSSVVEISRQVQEAFRIASEAVGQARKTNERVGELSKAAARIGDVVDLINSIAGQTNLLALNATIEAARAGDAGRGFAVVASEVKALAEQTAKATGDISQQIGGVQAATHESVRAIGEISGTIERLSEISSTIAAAVEEQGAATQEIARNIQRAASGTQQVSTNIVDVRREAAETGAASSPVLSAAQSLESGRLKDEVGRFLKTVRSS